MAYENLRPRLVTSLFLGAFVFLLMGLSGFCFGRYLLFFAGLAAVFIAAAELACVIHKDERFLNIPIYFLIASLPPIVLAAVVLNMQLCSAAQSALDRAALIAHASAALCFTFASFCVIYAGREHLEKADAPARVLYLTYSFIGFGGAGLLSLLIQPEAARLLGWLLIVVCTHDTAAYFAINVSSTLIAPAISPKKTLGAGVIGFTAAIFAGSIFVSLLPLTLTFWEGLFISISVALAAKMGDFIKSYVKRLYGVKDFGRLLPGHGGLLDRIDGVLAGGAVTFFLLTLYR